MPRTREELDLSRARQLRIIEIARKELEAIEAEISAITGNVKLDEAFFWGHLVPVLVSASKALTTAEIFAAIEARGLAISRDGLRVFVHRNKEKGRLIMITGDGPSKWYVSADTLSTARRLGYRPSNQIE